MEVREASVEYLPRMESSCPPGYKQTEVGVIPEDWCAVTFTTFGEIIDGDRGANYPSKKELMDSGFCLFLNAGNVTKNGFRFDESEFISEDKDRKLSKGKLARHDIVLTTRGTVGNTAFYSDDVPFDNIRINSGMVILRNTTIDIVNTQFIFSVLRSNILSAQIERLSFGSAQPQLTVRGISTFKLPLPPTKAEQEAIARALSDTDALIESLEQLIAKKRHIKQGAMQQLLTGKRRLPGFEVKHGFKDSEVGTIPNDWGTRAIFDLAERQKSQFDDGDWVEAEHITDQGVRLIQTGNIGICKFVEKEDKKYIYEKSFHKLRCKELIPGDLLICRLAEPAGRACILPALEDEKVITSVDVTIFRPPTRLANREYLAQYFSTNQWLGAVVEHVGGTTHKRISRSALGKLFVPYPSVAEQEAIANVLGDMDTEITALKIQLAKTRQLKQGMMHELLTGRIRLVRPGGKE